MKIGVLTEEVNNEDVAIALKEAGEKLDVEIVIFDLNEFAVVNSGSPEILYQGKPIQDIDACLVRGSESKLEFRLHIVEYLTKKNILVINNTESIRLCDNKFDTQTVLNGAGIKTPNTVSLVQIEQLDAAVHILEEKFPMIVKTQSGSHGVGVIKIDSYEGLKSIVQYLLAQKTNIMLQEFIPYKESGRIMILGDKVIAAVMRSIPDGDFRSNMDQGAELSKHEVTPEETEVALKVATTLGCILSAIDYIVDADGKMVIFEANSSPGLKGIQSVNEGIDIAGEIIKFIKDLIEKKPDEEDEEISSKKINVVGYTGIHVGAQTSPGADSGSEEVDPNGISTTPVDDGADGDLKGADEEEEELSSVGLEETIVIKRINDNKEFSAKVDTGADRCSLHGDKIEVGESFIRFALGETTYKVPLERKVTVIQSNGSESRPIAKFDVVFNGQTYDGIEFNISDRSDMSHQVIIGKNLLEVAQVLVNPAA